MLDWLYNILGSVLLWFSKITGGSYALALLLYALAFKILFIPFSIKQQKNQIASAKLTPKVELIRAKYRGNKTQAAMMKQQEEIRALQQKEGYSPMAGCLPLLLQLPIIIWLYNVIRNPLSYLAKLSDEVVTTLYGIVNNTPAEELANIKLKSIDQIALSGQIKQIAETGFNDPRWVSINPIIDVDALPSFNLWGLNLADKPEILSWLIFIPIFATAFQWLSMFITRKISGNAQAMTVTGDDTADNMQASMKMMDLMMPAMTLFFTFSFSAMMGLYWIYQSILGIIQTLILAKLMPIPKFTEEDIKMIQKAKKTAEKAQKAIIKTQPKYKSLHYIDEDDYDDLPEIKNNQNKNQKPMSGDDRPEIKD